MDDHIDSLTGLFRREYFENFLLDLLAEAKEQRFPVSLLVFEIRNWEELKNQLSSEACDQILREFSLLLRNKCKGDEIAARIGECEIAVIIRGIRAPDPLTDAFIDSFLEETRKVLKHPGIWFGQFQREVASLRFAEIEAVEKFVLDGGIAVFPWDATNSNDLIASALYAKLRANRDS